MFQKRNIVLCSCLSAVISSVAVGAPSIADEPKHSIADEPKVSLLDGQSHEVHTRLGKFGPMATVKLPPFKVTPRFESVTGYTDTGVPISRRKKMVLDQAKALAAKWEADYQKALKEGRAKPRPKVKTQAEQWAEENERILADERKYGRKTTENFIIPGMTPDQSKQVRESKNGGVIIRGGVQVHTILPTEEDFATGKAKRIDPTPEQWAAMEERSRANLENAFALKYRDGDEPSKGATGDVHSYFPDIPTQIPQTSTQRTQSNDVLEAFPDSTRSDKRQFSSTRSEKGIPVSFYQPKSVLGVDGIIDRGFQWLTGSYSANAKTPGEINPQLEVNPMAGAFDEIARQMANDKKALEKDWSEKTPSPALGQDQSKIEGNCDHCRLTPEDFDRAARAAKAISNRPEGRGVTDRETKVIDDITSILNDPKHPASFVNMLRQALEENPVVEEHIPDARERLGLANSKDDTPKEGTYIFVSYSLGDDILKEILGRNSGRKDVTIVMRGIPQGLSLGEGIKHMQTLASQFDPIPNIILDPTLFTQYDIKAVPAVVKVNFTEGYLAKFNVDARMKGREAPLHPPLIAKVDGLLNDEWLNQKIEIEHCSEEHPCQFGEQGPVFKIDEPDMIEEMKRRVAQIDWEKKKAEAMKRFWTNQTFDELPLAQKSVTRVLDPSIHVVADINDANGNPIRRAGDVVNPLDARPFESVLVIFNPTREAEMEAVEEKVNLLRAQGYSKFIYMATAIDRSRSKEDKELGAGWGQYEAVCDRLDSHVFMLTSEVKERWDVRVTPTFVTADNQVKKFIIEEVAPQDVR